MNKKIESLRASWTTVLNQLQTVETELDHLKTVRRKIGFAIADCQDSSHKRLYEQILKKTQGPLNKKEKQFRILNKKSLDIRKKLVVIDTISEICS